MKSKIKKSELIKNHQLGKKVYTYQEDDSLLVDILLKENRSLRKQLREAKKTAKEGPA